MIIDRDQNKDYLDQLSPGDLSSPDDPVDLSEQEDDLGLEDLEKRRDHRRKLTIRIIALMLAIAFVPLAFSGVLYLFGMPSFGILLKSIDLSRDPRYAEMRKAVVSVQADNRQGTGFNVDSAGLIVTNDHIIQDAKQVQISQKPDEIKLATTWQQWQQFDLAMVKAEGLTLPVLEMEAVGVLPSPGDQVTIIGNPLGLFQIVSQALYMGKTTLADHSGSVLMIRGPVFRGNSGSPVLNADGKVIGILFAISTGRSDYAGDAIGYVIPSEVILQIIRKN